MFVTHKYTTLHCCVARRTFDSCCFAPVFLVSLACHDCERVEQMWKIPLVGTLAKALFLVFVLIKRWAYDAESSSTLL